MIVYCDHLDTAFLEARPYVDEVMDSDALWMTHAWEDAWADMLHVWCGCPL